MRTWLDRGSMLRRWAPAMLALLAVAGLRYASTHPPRLEFEDYLDKSSESYRLLTLFRRQIHKDMNVAVRLEGADPLDPALWTAIARLETSLRRDPGVVSVESAIDLPLLDVDAADVKLTALTSRIALSHPLTRDVLGRTFAVHPFLVPYYVDPGGHAVALYVSLRGTLDDPRALAVVVDRIAGVVRRFATDRHLGVVLGGFPYLHTRLQLLTDVNQARSQVVLVVAMAVASLLLLGGWRSRLAVMAGALALMGASNLVFPIANLLGWSVRPGLVSAMIPTLVMILAISQLVQLQRLKRGEGPQEAAWALARLRAPVVGSALTNALGFFVLATFHSAPIRDFGILAGCAILGELALVALIAPSVLAWVDATPPGVGQTILDRALGRLPSIVHAARVPVALVLGLALALAARGLSLLEVRYDPREAVAPSHPFAAQIARGQELIGGNDLQVFVQRTDSAKVLTQKGLQYLDALEKAISRIPGVKLQISMLDYFRTLNFALNGRDRAFLAIPSTRDFARAMVLLPDDALLPFWLPQENLVRILVRLDRLDTGRLESFERRLARITPAGPYRVTVTGSEALYYHLAFELPRDLAGAIVLSLAALFVMFVLAERSCLRACLFLSPVAASLVVVYGTMGLAGVPLMVATAMIASVSSGLVVDTAYYLAHGYRPGDDLSARYAAYGPGAIIAGTLVITGFLTLLTSDFLYIRYFGVFLGIGLAAGLTMHCLFLPIVLLDAEHPRRLLVDFALLVIPSMLVLLAHQR